MTRREKHALRRVKKSERVLNEAQLGIDKAKSANHLFKDLKRAENDQERILGERRAKERKR